MEVYRLHFQPLQPTGIIGITLNQDWAEPYNPQSEENIRASQTRVDFQLGWFADPIFLGDYPESMIELVGDRLPRFTEAEKSRLYGSADFLGLNHYSTKYYFHKVAGEDSQSSQYPPHFNMTETLHGMRFGGWDADQKNFESKYKPNGELIGPQADSVWLNMVPWGFYKLLKWVDSRYSKSNLYTSGGVGAKKSKEFIVYITENGCDAPGESQKPLVEALNDTFRLEFVLISIYVYM